MTRLYVNVTEITAYGTPNKLSHLETRVAKTEKGAKTLWKKVKALKKYQGQQFSVTLGSTPVCTK